VHQKNLKNKLKILGFAGSLRAGSYNKLLLRAAGKLLPNDAILEIFDLADIPLFIQDIKMDMLSKIKEFKSKIRETDAILIATP
jgi:chromate reductase, NAD(P)H dehydrogenase (quinone)